MDEHKKYLADRLLSEERPITYRLLSRALDVHVNTAKEMLYDYHKYQNEARPGSIHASYLIYGTKASVSSSQADGDVEMSSSMPEHDGVSEDAPTTTLTLAGEDKLEATLAEYQEVTSIHIYSLAPHPQRDLVMLTEVTQSLSEYASKEDPVGASGKYGAITNPQVRRRKAGGRQKLAPTNGNSSTVKKEPAPAKPAPAAKVKQEAKAPESAVKKEPAPAASTAKAPAPKKPAAGGIMSSFAKAKPPKPKPEVKKEDPAMALSDDGEADEEDLPATKKAAEDSDAIRRSRKEREEELRRMMDEDEDEDEPEEKDEEPEDEEMPDEPEPEPVQDETKAKPKEESGPAEVVASSGNGRRRGKRRVTKKKRIVDDQGYMVTIQESGWESFSEDEAPATKTPISTPASSAAKAKKPAGKPGQGNIMSFFGKK